MTDLFVSSKGRLAIGISMCTERGLSGPHGVIPSLPNPFVGSEGSSPSTPPGSMSAGSGTSARGRRKVIFMVAGSHRRSSGRLKAGQKRSTGDRQKAAPRIRIGAATTSCLHQLRSVATRRQVFVASIAFCFSILTSSYGVADEAALWRALRSGGHVALLRHAIAPGTGDPPASSWKIAAHSAICRLLDALRLSASASSSAPMALAPPVFSPANGAVVSTQRNISASGRLKHCPCWIHSSGTGETAAVRPKSS